MGQTIRGVRNKDKEPGYGEVHIILMNVLNCVIHGSQRFFFYPRLHANP